MFVGLIISDKMPWDENMLVLSSVTGIHTSVDWAEGAREKV